MERWSSLLDHYPAAAAIVRIPDGVLYQAAGYVIVALATALVTLWIGQKNVEADLKAIRAEVVDIRQQVATRNEEMNEHVRDANRLMNQIQVDLLKHRLQAEKAHVDSRGKEGP